MNIIQKRKILVKIAELESDIEQLKQVRLRLAENEYASCSLASGGGSKSYTKQDVSKVVGLIQILTSELNSYRKMINGAGAGMPKETIFVY